MFLWFYNGKTLNYVQDLSTDVVNLSFTQGLKGSVSGNVEVEITNDNSAFLSGLKENSHFLKFGVEKAPVGAVIDTISRTGNILKIEFIGFYEYSEKIDLVASHKAGLTTEVASQNDQSFIKNFYADSSLGILWEVFKNNAETMVSRNNDASLFSYGMIRSKIVSNTDSEWAKSYRLNSLETPTLKNVFDDIFSEDDISLLKVYVAPDKDVKFSFIFSYADSQKTWNFSEKDDDIFNITVNDFNVENRSFSLAKGTNLRDQNVVERVGFSNNSAYSSLISTSQQERSDSIRRQAENAKIKAATNDGDIKFSVFNDDLRILDFVNVEFVYPFFETFSGIITEKNIEGNVITYNFQRNAGNSPMLSKPQDQSRRMIFGKLNNAQDLSERTASKKNNTTGWRS